MNVRLLAVIIGVSLSRPRNRLSLDEFFASARECVEPMSILMLISLHQGGQRGCASFENHAERIMLISVEVAELGFARALRYFELWTST